MTLTVISESRVSYIAISLVVAGQDMPISSSTGMTVQISSAVVLWVKVSANVPLELLRAKIAKAIAAKTNPPMPTHIHSAIILASHAWFDSVLPATESVR